MNAQARAGRSGDLWGGLAAMLVALPSAIAFGVTIFAPLGPSYAAQGALAGILGTIAIGLVAPLFGGTNRLISAPVRAGGGGARGVRHQHVRRRRGAGDHPVAAGPRGADLRPAAAGLRTGGAGTPHQVHALPRCERVPERRRSGHRGEPGAQTAGRARRGRFRRCARRAVHLGVAGHHGGRGDHRGDAGRAAGHEAGAGGHSGAGGRGGRVLRHRVLRAGAARAGRQPPGGRVLRRRRRQPHRRCSRRAGPQAADIGLRRPAARGDAGAHPVGTAVHRHPQDLRGAGRAHPFAPRLQPRAGRPGPRQPGLHRRRRRARGRADGRHPGESLQRRADPLVRCCRGAAVPAGVPGPGRAGGVGAHRRAGRDPHRHRLSHGRLAQPAPGALALHGAGLRGDRRGHRRGQDREPHRRVRGGRGAGRPAVRARADRRHRWCATAPMATACSRARSAARRPWRCSRPTAGRPPIFELQGSLFFGTTDQLYTALEPALENSRFIILDLRRVQTVDVTAAHMLERSRGHPHRARRPAAVQRVAAPPAQRARHAGVLLGDAPGRLGAPRAGVRRTGRGAGVGGEPHPRGKRILPRRGDGRWNSTRWTCSPGASPRPSAT